MKNNNKKNNNKSHDRAGVMVGPDLNCSKSPLDKKLYRQVILAKNGLRVVLISDTVAMGQHPHPRDLYDDDDDESESEMEEDSSEEEEDEEEEEEEEIRKAAAAMVVGVGSYFDPPHAQGLAHFLEHMLFMGTAKYPQENAYDAFMSKYGGSDNAYTDMEHTIYHFDIIQEKFFQALDMFAQFFIEPLMLPDAVDRELNAIESEFQLSLNDDESRWQQILAHTSRLDPHSSSSSPPLTASPSPPWHPFGNFAWGNLKSLREDPQRYGIDMMKELHDFYHQYYYSHNMRLVVVGAYSLDELERHVVKCFSNIPALPRRTVVDSHSLYLQHTESGTWKERVHTPISQLGMPFASHALQCIYRIVPVKDRHSLTITWQVPSQRKVWKSRPCDYISHLLGHEAQGSLLSFLKAKMWVNGCSAGVGSSDFENASSHALFTINFTLTEEGVPFWKDIVTETYHYIGMLRYHCNSSNGLPSYIYDELRRVQECSFQFEDESSPSDLVERMAELLAPYKEFPPERLLDGEILLFEFDRDQIKEILDKHLQPQNARIDLMSSSFGRAADFIDKECSISSIAEEQSPLGMEKSLVFNIKTGQVEPYFSTQYWCDSIPDDITAVWAEAASLPLSTSQLHLPQPNPFIPCDFHLKSLPLDDSHHPLLHCSIKVCLPCGKSKLWFPAIVTRYDGTQNRILVSHEDGEEKFYKLDSTFVEMSHHTTVQDLEGTLEGKKIKYRVTAVAKKGQVATSSYEDGTDGSDEDNLQYPSIPPAQAKNRLPYLVTETKFAKLWHLQDRKFKRPKVEFRLSIISSEINTSAKHRACAELLAMLCHDACTEICYLASICELNSSISTTDVGFTIRVHGFNDKILELADAIMKVLFSFRESSNQLPSCILPGRFEKNLETLLRKYGNMGMTSSALCGIVRLRCLRQDHWSAYSKAEGITHLNTDDFMSYITRLLDGVCIEALLHGNVHAEDAIKASKLIQEYVVQRNGKGLEQNPAQQVLMVPIAANNFSVTVPCIDVTEPSTAVEVYFQMGKDDIVSRVIIDLLAHLIHEPLFHELRTKEQFGYDVHSSSRWTFGVMGLSFCVVTSSKSAQEVTDRLERFLFEFRATLASMTPQVFLENMVAVAETKLESFTSLEDECNNLWYEVTEKRYDWEVNRNEVVALRSVTLEQTLQAYNEWLFPPSTKRRRLVVQVIGMHEEQHTAAIGAGHSTHDEISRLIDNQVRNFHETTSHFSWGKIY